MLTVIAFASGEKQEQSLDLASDPDVSLVDVDQEAKNDLLAAGIVTGKAFHITK